jgi:hypothetical protein
VSARVGAWYCVRICPPAPTPVATPARERYFCLILCRQKTGRYPGDLQDDLRLQLRTNRGRGGCRTKQKLPDRNGNIPPLPRCHARLTGVALFGPHPTWLFTRDYHFSKVSCDRVCQGSRNEVGVVAFWFVVVEVSTRRVWRRGVFTARLTEQRGSRMDADFKVDKAVRGRDT